MNSRQVRCPKCGRLLCKVRLTAGSTAVIEDVCVRCKRPVSVEIKEMAA
jgi:phage FluMu protein Com